jgi:glycosyltransferase involved in cell wall biosynthesis
MSRIGLNLLFLNPKLVGGSTKYGINLLRELSLIDKRNTYYVYINKGSIDLMPELGSNFVLRVLNFEYSSVFLRYFWEQIILPFYVFKDKIDLLHSLGYVIPLMTTTKSLVSILDINYRGHSNNMSLVKRLMLGLMVNLSALFAKKIITISEFSKSQIIKYVKVNPNKVIVTLLSGSNDFQLGAKVNTKLIFEKYEIDTDYIIAFSSPSLHKNIERLIEAVSSILNNDLNLKLLLVGHQDKSGNIKNIIVNQHLSDKVVFTGFVPDDYINPLLTHARVFVFPSLYEGFGIPLLDAQACGVPVVSSNAGSLPEVGGSDVMYFDPYDINEMKQSIFNVLYDNFLAEFIVKKGLENRSQFNWKKTAQNTLKIYREMLSSIQ